MSTNERPYAQPMTQEERFRQEVLMYVRDQIISPIMPPIKKYNKQLGIWLKSRDAVLIDKLSAKHTDKLIEIFTKEKL